MSSTSASSRIISFSILALCLVSVLVGIWKASSEQFSPASQYGPTTDGQTGKPAKLLSSLGSKDYLALISVEGPINSTPEGNSLFGALDSNAMAAKKALDAAAEDNKVRGVLLYVNSPGGTVGMSQELHAAVGRVREKKPVVVSMGDMAASGGYYTAVAADQIVANRGTLTASIGVIINGMNFKGLAEKLGVSAEVYKSGKFKDVLSPYRAAKPEERELLQNVVDESYADFLSAVLEGRTRDLHSVEEKEKRSKLIRSVADGRIVLGTQALRYGLVDAVGDRDKAEDMLEALVIKRFRFAGEPDIPLKPFSKEGGFADFLGLGASAKQPFPQAAAPWLSPLLGLPASQPTVVNINLGPASAFPMPLSMRYPNQPLWIVDTMQ